MDLKTFSKGAVVYYVPKWKSQRELYERGELDSPVIAVITPLTRGEVKRYLQSASSGDLASVAGELFASCTKEVKNLNVDGKSIKNGKELWEYNDAPPEVEELVGELARALLDSSLLSDGEVKRLKN